MLVSGKIYIFPEEIRKLGDGSEMRNINTSISTKQEDGSYINMTLEVKFNKEKIPMSKLLKLDVNKCYELEILDGWLSVRKYTNQNGDERRVLYIFCNDGKLTGSKEIQKKPKEEKPSDLPF